MIKEAVSEATVQGQMEPFVIIYDNRFPKQQRRADGSWGCRGCGGVIPKRRQAWCSNQCRNRWHPTFVIIAVKKRDKEICAACGLDCAKAYAEWMKDRGTFNYSRWKWSNPPPPKAEYDHIIPFSEGGLTVLENMRTLCSDCHKQRTRDWHRERKQEGHDATRALNSGNTMKLHLSEKVTKNRECLLLTKAIDLEGGYPELVKAVNATPQNTLI